MNEESRFKAEQVVYSSQMAEVHKVLSKTVTKSNFELLAILCQYWLLKYLKHNSIKFLLLRQRQSHH